MKNKTAMPMVWVMYGVIVFGSIIFNYFLFPGSREFYPALLLLFVIIACLFPAGFFCGYRFALDQENPLDIKSPDNTEQKEDT